MERLDLTRQVGKDRQRRWRQGASQAWDTTSVEFGRLADGRWFAERFGHDADVDDRQQGACVFSADERGELLALRLAYRWMSAGEWRAVPAAFGADGKPLDGLPWVRRGADWVLEG